MWNPTRTTTHHSSAESGKNDDVFLFASLCLDTDVPRVNAGKLVIDTPRFQDVLPLKRATLAAQYQHCKKTTFSDHHYRNHNTE
jgi:hypothetical protein